MADPFIAEIRVFPFNFAPEGWAFCNGEKIPVSQNEALFSLLGATYGGDGRTSFALPDMRGNAPMQPGHGIGLFPHKLGERGGSETVTLQEGDIPAHSHGLMGTPASAEAPGPIGNSFARASGANIYQTDSTQDLVDMASATISSTGGGKPHDNMMPYLTLNFCIALQGVFPERA